MSDFYEEHCPEVNRATEAAKAGNTEIGIEILQGYIQKQKGELSWALYYATFVLEALQIDDSQLEPETPRASERLFNQLVPKHITKQDLAQRLRAETENFLRLYQQHQGQVFSENCIYLVALTTQDFGQDFQGNLRSFSETEFVDFIWLDDGYTKWVDLSLYRAESETTFIIALVGGRVETFREVLHHDEGYAPFRTR